MQWGLSPGVFEHRRNRRQILDRAASREQSKRCKHFLELHGAPRTWDTHDAKVLTSSTEMEQSRYDGCLFYRSEPLGQDIEENAGRHIDAFLVTGRENERRTFS